MTEPPLDEILSLADSTKEAESRDQLIVIVIMAIIITVMWILEYLNDDESRTAEDQTNVIGGDSPTEER